MRILADTCAYSAFLRGHAGLKTTFQQAEQIAVNPVVLGELRAGFVRGGRVLRNEKLLETFLASPRVIVLPIDAETSHRYARIVDTLRGAGTPIPTNDIWIAATAMQHGLRVATTDAHYQKVRSIVVDWFSP